MSPAPEGEYMDEATFEIDQQQLSETSRRFPAHRLSAPDAHPDGDLRFLSRGGEFGTHAWDEGGHL